MNAPTLATIEAAAAQINGRVYRTPVLTAPSIDATVAPGAALHFKCENLQRTGAFKIRGATHAVLSLSDEAAARGVATHSSGNHGAALAAAAADRGIPCHVVVPEGAVPVKVAAIEAWGGRVVPCAATQAAREAGLAAVLAATGATPIHPYDDPVIIAGQGTVALEFLTQVPDLDVLVVPVGGGGLIAGCAIAARALRPDIRIVGAEPTGADDTARSVAAGALVPVANPDTIADGLRATIGHLNFELVRTLVDEIVTVPDAATLTAMRDLWAILKVVVEPSSATVLAAARARRDTLAGQRIGLVLSGGNVDLARIPFCPRCVA